MASLVGFQLPEALAGKNSEVTFDEEGARRVVELVGGVAGGLGILAVGAYIYRYVAGIAGAKQNVGDLY